MKKTLLFTLFFAALTLTVSAGEIYDSAYPIEHNAARVVKDLKWGLLNEKLEEVLAPKWDYLGELSENLRMVRAGTLSGFADAGGKQVIAPQFSQAMDFSEGLACVKNESGKWGYINTSGSLVIPYLYDEANSFSSGLALIKQNGLYGYIDADNNPVIPPTYQEAYPFYEGRACVKVEDKYGYIDTNGVMVIKPEFSLAFDFSEGAAVIKTEKYGLIG